MKSEVSNSICFVAPYAYNYINPGHEESAGGAERQQYLLGNQLLKDGYDVHYIVFKQGTHRRYENNDGMNIWKVLNPLNTKKDIIENFHSIYYYIKKINSDVYYSRGNIKLAMATSHICRLLNKKYIYAVADDTNVTDTGSKVLNYLFRNSLKNSDLVVTQSSHQKNLLSDSFGINSKTIPNMHHLPPESEVPDYSNRDYILWVGRIQKEQKKPHRFVSLAEKMPQYNFRLVGPTSDSEYSRSIIKRIEDSDNIVYSGFVKPDEIDKYYKSAYLLVNTSDYEGFPNTFLEAWSYGVPVFSYSFDLDGELVEYKIGGQYSNISKLELEIKKLLNEECYWKSFSHSSRNHFKENYTIDKIYPHYKNII